MNVVEWFVVVFVWRGFICGFFYVLGVVVGGCCLLGVGGVVEALRCACGELVRVFGNRFVGLVLFGSWARGEAGVGSDVDVFVVLRGGCSFDVRSKVYRVVAKHVRRHVTLVCVDVSDILREDFELTPLMINIVYDGIVVCDRDGVVSSFIEKGREFIRRIGLVRYRTPDGKYGWKRANGKPIAYLEV